jgi:hypothetical protein
MDQNGSTRKKNLLKRPLKALGGTGRIGDSRFRKPPLYPAELWGHAKRINTLLGSVGAIVTFGTKFHTEKNRAALAIRFIHIRVASRLALPQIFDVPF